MLNVQEQDRIAEQGAAAQRSCQVNVLDKSTLNPYQPGTDEFGIWLAGYEAEAECAGSDGRDW